MRGPAFALHQTLCIWLCLAVQGGAGMNSGVTWRKNLPKTEIEGRWLREAIGRHSNGNGVH